MSRFRKAFAARLYIDRSVAVLGDEGPGTVVGDDGNAEIAMALLVLVAVSGSEVVKVVVAVDTEFGGRGEAAPGFTCSGTRRLLLYL